MMETRPHLLGVLAGLFLAAGLVFSSFVVTRTWQRVAEAQAIAVLVREALDEPERRVAVITPDRSLAARVVAHLGRWNIGADDTAGRPLPQTAAGRVILQLAEVVAERAAPVPLLALLGHPLVCAGGGRARCSARWRSRRWCCG